MLSIGPSGTEGSSVWVINNRWYIFILHMSSNNIFHINQTLAQTNYQTDTLMEPDLIPMGSGSATSSRLTTMGSSAPHSSPIDTHPVINTHITLPSHHMKVNLIGNSIEQQEKINEQLHQATGMIGKWQYRSASAICKQQYQAASERCMQLHQTASATCKRQYQAASERCMRINQATSVICKQRNQAAGKMCRQRHQMMSSNNWQQAQLANNSNIIAPSQSSMTKQEKRYQRSMRGIETAWQDMMSRTNTAWRGADTEVAVGSARTGKNVVHMLSYTAKAASGRANKRRLGKQQNGAINGTIEEMRKKMNSNQRERRCTIAATTNFATRARKNDHW